MTLLGAQLFVECLREEGVEYVFSVSGGQTLSILDALYDQPGIRHVTARHEAAAASMADAHARVSGKPAVVIATTGPGATNLPTAVGNAHRDSVPMIVVTVNNYRRDIGYDEPQDADHVAVMRQFVKSSRFVGDPEMVGVATREAFRAATTGNPGPAHLDFAREAVERGELAFVPLNGSSSRARHAPIAAEASIAAAAERIRRAERPVLWAGRGAIIANATDALLALAEAAQIPVCSTYNGIGAFPGNHPLWIGPRSRWGGRPGNAALAEADLVIAVGNSLNSISTTRSSLTLPDTVQIDCDPMMIGRRYPVAVPVLGDAADALQRIAAALRPGSGAAARAPWVETMQGRFAAWRKQIHDPILGEGTPVHPLWVMRQIEEQFGPDDVICYDAGNCGIWAQAVSVRKPRHYMKPVGFGAMGFALPAAIGVKVTRPDAHAVAVVGDGALGMSLCELETAVRERSPVVVIVFNDCALGNIRQLQLKQYGQRHIGVDYGDIRFADAARAFGADGERVSSAAELPAAIGRAKASPVPYVVDILIDKRVSVWDDPF
jgi:acetolactate synthase-1/2/3 large subunit